MKKFFSAIAAIALVVTVPSVSAAPPEKVTLCHAAGRSGTLQFTTLIISYQAAYGQAGHFNEDGSPAAGHEDDYLGPCAVVVPQTTTTVADTTTTIDTTTTVTDTTTTIITSSPTTIGPLVTTSTTSTTVPHVDTPVDVGNPKRKPTKPVYNIPPVEEAPEPTPVEFDPNLTG